MSQRDLRPLVEWMLGKLRARPILGKDSWLEISHKLTTIAALFFGAWAYFNSVQPVFEKEQDLQTQRERAQALAHDLEQLRLERSLLQQQLERFQAVAAANRRGIVLSHLSNIKKELQREARTYQQLAPGAFDLRDYSLAYADALLEMLGPVEPGSPESYQKEALEFLREFVIRNIPPKATDVRWFNQLLDAYDRQDQAP